MNNLVLPHYILGHFLTNHRCGRCGRCGQPQSLLYPTITRNLPNVVLTYPTRCGCGGSGHVTITMPLILFGHILAWAQILDAYGRQRKGSIVVVPGASDLFAQIIREFEQLTRWPGSSGSGPSGDQSDSSQLPTSLDRLCFGLNDAEWADFLRRTGLDEQQDPPR